MNYYQTEFHPNGPMCSTQLQFYGPMKSDLAPFLEVCTLHKFWGSGKLAPTNRNKYFFRFSNQNQQKLVNENF